MSMRKRLAELFFGTESQLRMEIGRLEQTNKILKKQRGRAYKELNKDHKTLKRKYDEVLLELAVKRRHGIPFCGSSSRERIEQVKNSTDSDVAGKLSLQDKIVEMQDKLDEATTMLQEAGLDCCKLVYTKIDKARKQEIFELSQNLISARTRWKDSAEEHARINKSLKELKGEQHG